MNELLSTSPKGIAPQARVVHTALHGADRPIRILHWLNHQGVPELLTHLARTGADLRHHDLDELPDTPTTSCARDLLPTAGVLPQRNEAVERLPRWADAVLREVPAHHRQIVSPFAHWHLIHRHRRMARGHAGQAVRDGHRRSQIRRALELLTWLDEQGTALPDLKQTNLEQWLVSGPPNRRDVRVFILWTNERGLTSSLEVPARSPEDPATFIEDDDRVEQLRRCVNDATLPLDVRVIGSLVLLMGLQVTRILELTVDDVVVQDSAVQLKLDGGFLTLPPRLAHLVRQQLHHAEDAWESNRAASTIPWLFAGLNPARPIQSQYIYLKLRRLGLSGLAGRNTARLALAADVPASILAVLTGTSIDNATDWANFVKRNWTDYIARRAQDRP
ncbi:hypothetical protein ACFW2I_31740 [Streptomyces nigra]|uniref:hypothetical protein n=1 Tax=Streptomyces nigra TaxID=1827580 RepID=UPI0036A722DF